MSKDLAVIEPKEYAIMQHSPESFRQTMVENIGVGGTLGVADLQKISIPTGGSTIWQVPSLTGKPEMLEEVVGIPLLWRSHRAYWEKGMDQGGSTPPDCLSLDGVNGEMRPGSEAKDVGQGGLCAACPLSKFGSNEKGNRQACKDMRQIFLLRPNRLLPSVVNLSPTSVTPFKAFMASMTAENIPYHRCIISIGLIQDVSAEKISYSKATFKVQSLLAGKDLEAMARLRDEMLPFLLSTQITDDDR